MRRTLAWAVVAALPGRNPGKVVRIGRTGKVETLLENARTLPAPIAVAADPGTGDVLVADNDADVVLLLPGGRASEARVVVAIDGHKGHLQDMSVAFAADGHLLFGGSGPVGVYRFKGGPAATLGEPVVGEPGGVMSAPGSRRWAAALGGELRVFEGTREVAALPYPAGRRLWHAAVALGPGGTPTLALHLGGNRYEVVEADLDRKGFKTLFGWGKSRVVCLAIGPKMAWKD